MKAKRRPALTQDGRRRAGAAGREGGGGGDGGVRRLRPGLYEARRGGGRAAAGDMALLREDAQSKVRAARLLPRLGGVAGSRLARCYARAGCAGGRLVRGAWGLPPPPSSPQPCGGVSGGSRAGLGVSCCVGVRFGLRMSQGFPLLIRVEVGFWGNIRARTSFCSALNLATSQTSRT